MDRPAPGVLNPLVSSLTSSWDALDFYQNAVLTGWWQIPPDPIGAAGPANLVSVMNTSIQFYTKTGVLQYQARMGRGYMTVVGSFFEPLNPANHLFDPKVLYDQYAGRFVVVALEQVTTTPQASRILMAVSDDADPNGLWYYGAINSMVTIDGSATWADYPGLAVDDQAVYITTNQFPFSGTGSGARLFIVNKAPLYTGGAIAYTVNDYYTPIGSFATTGTPVHIFGVGPTGVSTWIARYSGFTDSGSPNMEYLSLIPVSNPLGVPVFGPEQFIPLGNIDTASGALPLTPQLGTSIPIHTFDRRVFQAVWRNNRLYMVFDVNPPVGDPETGQCTVHWLKLDTTTPAVIFVADQGNVGAEDLAPGTSTSFPSIAVNVDNDLAIGFAAGSPTTYQGAYFTGRRSTDPAGTVQPTGTLAAGIDWYVRTFTAGSLGRNRWGDFSGTVIDPDGCTFWHFNEYAITRGNPLTTEGTTEDGQYMNRWGSWTFCEPVAVELAYFAAERSGTSAVIRWSVSADQDYAGFHVYRSEPGQDRVQISTELLSGKVDYEFVDAGAPARGDYWLKEIGRGGEISWHGPATLAAASLKVPVFQLGASQPNPFRTATTIAYSLPARGEVSLRVYDAQGRKVTTLVRGVQESGEHSVSWNGATDNGSAASAGFYVIRLQAGNQVRTRKVVIAR